LHLSGSADPLVKLASEFEVLDLSSAPPDLDELFMQYYEDEGGEHGAADH
jgi:hypothetical protein